MLKRNMDSFRRLGSIAARATFSRYVKTLVYDGEMLQSPENYMRFRDWYAGAIGQGFNVAPSSYAIEDFKESLTDQQLDHHYQKYCEFEWSERLLKIDGREYQHLVDLMGNLPCLEEICYDSGIHCWRPSQDGPIVLDKLSSIARETLVEPTWEGGYGYHIEQFISLLRATSFTTKNTTSIRISGVPLAAFDRSDENSTAMIESTRNCRVFSLETKFDPDHYAGESILPYMIANADFLHTLEISFGQLTYQRAYSISDVEELLKGRNYWPSLKRLRLHGVYVSGSYLIELLSRHASTLRSLHLGDIRLVEEETLEPDDPWIPIIRFLESSMDIEVMSFERNLSHYCMKAWCIDYSDEIDFGNRDIKRRPRCSCIQRRVELFVVEGGAFPFADAVRWGSSFEHL